MSKANRGQLENFKRLMSGLESSSGKDTSHSTISNPNSMHYNTSAYGDTGLMPNTIKDFANRSNSDIDSAISSMSPNQITQTLEENPEVEQYYFDKIARHVLNRSKGEPAKAAKMWKHGTTAIDEERIDKIDPMYNSRIDKWTEGMSSKAPTLEIPALQKAYEESQEVSPKPFSKIKTTNNSNIPQLKEATGREFNAFELTKDIEDQDFLEAAKQRALMKLRNDSLSEGERKFLENEVERGNDPMLKGMVEGMQNPTAGVITSYKDAGKLLASKSGEELLEGLFKGIKTGDLPTMQKEVGKLFGFLKREQHGIDGNTPKEILANVRKTYDPNDITAGFKSIDDKEAREVIKALSSKYPEASIMTPRELVADKFSNLSGKELNLKIQEIAKETGLDPSDVKAAILKNLDNGTKGFIVGPAGEYTGRVGVNSSLRDIQKYNTDDLDKLNDIATSIHEVPGHLGDLRYTPEFKASRYKTPSVDEINSIINNSKLSPGQKRKAALDLTTKNHFADFPTANAELQTILDTVQGNPETWANLNKLLKGQ